MVYPEKVEGIVAISKPTAEILTERQLVAYRTHREDLINWLVHRGKDPEKREVYAFDTARNYASILDKLHRWVWDEQDGFTMDISHEDADDYLDGLMTGGREYSGSHLHNVKLALKCYFRYSDDEWETDIVVSNPSHAAQPKDYVTEDERSKLREAVLEYGSIPAYPALTPEERSEWKQYLARRFGKSVDDVTREDWERANGYKYESRLYVTGRWPSARRSRAGQDLLGRH